MLNNLNLSGRLTSEPENRSTSEGRQRVSFTLAVERDYKSKDGKKITDFINCVAWGVQAQYIERYYHKGDMCLVTGKLETSSYMKDGENRYTTYCTVTSVYFTSNKA